MSRFGRVCSPETRAKLSAAHMGKVMSAEARAKMAAAKQGIPRTAEQKAKVSAAMFGRRVIGRKRPPARSVETRAKLSIALKGRAPSALCKQRALETNVGSRHADEHRARIGAALLGRKRSPETRAALSASAQRAWAEGRSNLPPKVRYTKLARRLHAYLEQHCGITGLEIEVRFGRYQVDLFDAATRTAFEADGAYWHNRNELRSPGYHDRRETALRSQFGVRVVRFSDSDIDLTARKAGIQEAA